MEPPLWNRIRVVSYRNSTSNHNNPRYLPNRKNVVSYRNSTSNHNVFFRAYSLPGVVSYRNSTSNHNQGYSPCYPVPVVSYRNSTSNHNVNSPVVRRLGLYLIEILHQTTTRLAALRLAPRLYLIEILHQTTTRNRIFRPILSCILSKFYIKPQLLWVHSNSAIVVSYRNSTSNHNAGGKTAQSSRVVSYRNSTSNHNRNK